MSEAAVALSPATCFNAVNTRLRDMLALCAHCSRMQLLSSHTCRRTVVHFKDSNVSLSLFFFFSSPFYLETAFLFVFFMVRLLISPFIKGCLGLKVYPAAHSIRNQELNVCILILLACCDYECLLFYSFLSCFCFFRCSGLF